MQTGMPEKALLHPRPEIVGRQQRAQPIGLDTGAAKQQGAGRSALAQVFHQGLQPVVPVGRRGQSEL